jgi:hypothetical protein
MTFFYQGPQFPREFFESNGGYCQNLVLYTARGSDHIGGTHRDLESVTIKIPEMG